MWPRHPEEQVGHIGVKDSATFQQFGQQQMSKPGEKAQLETREFLNLLPEEVKERKASLGQVKTLNGIKSKFYYLCFPDGKVCFNIYFSYNQTDLGPVEAVPLLLYSLHDPELGAVPGQYSGGGARDCGGGWHRHVHHGHGHRHRHGHG